MPMTYFATGEPQVEKTDLGLKITVPISINDANGRRVCDETLSFAMPAGLDTDEAMGIAIVKAANAAGKARLVELEATLATKAVVSSVAGQIEG